MPISCIWSGQPAYAYVKRRRPPLPLYRTMSQNPEHGKYLFNIFYRWTPSQTDAHKVLLYVASFYESFRCPHLEEPLQHGRFPRRFRSGRVERAAGRRLEQTRHRSEASSAYRRALNTQAAPGIYRDPLRSPNTTRGNGCVRFNEKNGKVMYVFMKSRPVLSTRCAISVY